MRWAATVAFLVVVALVAGFTAGGIDTLRVPRTPVVPTEDPCQEALPERSVGIAPGSAWKRDPRAPADMGEMAGIGVRWIRLGFEWAVIEPRPGRYRWDSVDRIMERTPATCLSVLAMVGTTPQWARAPGCPTLWCPPRDPAAFARFVTEVAKRYATKGIRAWEVWNEPNHAAWWEPEPDPHAYGELLVASAGAIRAVDPGATVLSAGLAPSPPGGNARRVLPDRFLRGVYDSGAMDVVDAVAYHPYSFPDLPSARTGNNGFTEQLSRLRDVMVDHGDEDEKVWLTEFGFATTGAAPGLMARQVEMVVDAFATWRSLDYVGPFFWFNWRDLETGSSDPQQNFGLRRSADRPKPAYGAFVQELDR